MSEENVKMVRRSYEHVERTREFWREMTHPDFIWDTTTFRGGMRPQRCVGLDEANKWLAEWLEDFDNWSLGVEEVFDAGDQVVAIVLQRANAKHSGLEVEMRFGQVWTFRNGLVARIDMYADRVEALEAAGLSE